MANVGSVVAHFVKLVAIVACMQYFRDAAVLKPTNQVWAVRALQILLIHSILGIIRYGISNTTKHLRFLYNRLSTVIEVVPFALFATELFIKYELSDDIRYMILGLGLLPTVVEMSLPKIKDRSFINTFTNVIFFIQSLMIIIACIGNDTYGGLTLAASAAVARFLSEDYCDFYEVPYVDMFQYSSSFLAIFATCALQEI